MAQEEVGKNVDKTLANEDPTGPTSQSKTDFDNCE
jgi:hypothetical protein